MPQRAHKGVTAPNGNQGPDLDEVLRGALARRAEANGWNETQAGEATGLGQRTYNRFMKREQGLKLEKVSILCASLGVLPSELLGSTVGSRDPRQDQLDRFRTALTPREADLALAQIEEQKRLGIFDQCTSAVEGLISVVRGQSGRARPRRTARR